MSDVLQGARTLCRDCKHAKLGGWPGLRWIVHWGSEYALCKARPQPGGLTYNHWTGLARTKVTDDTHHLCSTVNRDLHCPHFEEKPVVHDETCGCHTRSAAAHGLVFWLLLAVGVLAGACLLWPR